MRIAAILLCLTLGSAVAADPTLSQIAGADCTFHRSDDATVIAIDNALKRDGTSLALTLEAGAATSAGDWFVLGATLCQIGIPYSPTELHLDDPDVQPHYLPFVANADFDEYGCFIDRFAMQADLMATRGWNEDRAYDEVNGLIANGLADGDIAFYSDDILATPRSFQVMVGACGDVPDAPAIAQSHEIWRNTFGETIRALGAATDCGRPDTGAGIVDIARDVGGAEQTNVWSGIGHLIVVLAAGWREGASASQKGTPRPPLCHYP